MTDTIVFTEDTAKQFRAAYKQARADGEDQFVFQDKDVLTSYAHYLCEYLVMQGLLKAEK